MEKIPAKLVKEETVIVEGEVKLQHYITIAVPSTHYYAFMQLLASAGIVEILEPA